MPDNAISLVTSYLQQLQKRLCDELAGIDGQQTFIKDNWSRSEGGGGVSCVLSQGAVFEKAGVNFSQVHGQQLPASASASRPEIANASFHATGLSVVIHPDNPFIPTSHANVRFFVAERDNAPPVWWFGGGFDLTPYYGFTEDCIHWHQTAFEACQPFGKDLYPRFKQWCDEYFYIRHRQEARGIGGLFFDDFNEQSFEHSYGLFTSIGDHFIKAYAPIVNNRLHLPYDEAHKAFQKYRRGRYAEFNLVYDRGTLFGLQSGGRTESILMSLPPEVNWVYQWHPEKDSPEEQLYTNFLPVRDWLDIKNNNSG